MDSISTTTTDPISFEQLRADISACRTIESFAELFDRHALFQAALGRLEQFLTGANPLDVSKDWAIRMRGEPMEDRHINECRKACLMLLYELCNQWRKADNQSVTEASIISIFGRDRIVKILTAAMPLDRAQCLYKMMYTGGGQFGMHWVADQHIEAHPEIWEQPLRSVSGRSTMNKRYLWLANLPQLQLAQANAVLQVCFQPQPAPWAEWNVGLNDGDDIMGDTIRVDHLETLAQRIQGCSTVEEFRDVYDGQHFAAAVGALRVAQGTMDPIEWASEWAIRMRDEPPSEDDALYNSIREILILVLDRLWTCSNDATNTSITEESIVATFSGHRMVNIVRYSLPMERAWCRFTRQYPPEHSQGRYGMHWFSSQHAENDPNTWGKWLEAAGGATMHPCFPWLRDIKELSLQQEYILTWLEPCPPEWPMEDDEDEAME